MSKREAEYSRVAVEIDNESSLQSQARNVDTLECEDVKEQEETAMMANNQCDHHWHQPNHHPSSTANERIEGDHIELTILSDHSASSKAPSTEEEGDTAAGSSALRSAFFDRVVAASVPWGNSEVEKPSSFEEEAQEKNPGEPHEVDLGEASSDDEADTPAPDSSEAGFVWLRNHSRMIFVISFLLMTAFYIWHYPTYESGIALVLLLLLHEFGHYWAFKMAGIQPAAMIFIPFLGAAVIAENQGETIATIGYVGLAGPLFGCAGGGIMMAAYLLTLHPYLGYIAAITFRLNLVNMLPLLPLDGGLVALSIHPVFAGVWFALLVVLFLVVAISSHDFGTGMLILVAALSTKARIQTWWDNRHMTSYQIHWLHRVAQIFAWCALVAIMITCTIKLERDPIVSAILSVYPF